MTHLQAIAVWRRQTVEASQDALVPSSKLAVLHKAVLDACDAQDGVKDGVLEDPTRCDSIRAHWCARTTRTDHA